MGRAPAGTSLARAAEGNLNINHVEPSQILRKGFLMKKLLGYGFAASVIAGLGVIGVTSNSDARSLTAFLGQPQSPADYSCFTNSGGTVTNNCSTTRQFCVVLPVDDSTHTIEITLFAPDINHNIACLGQANFRDNTSAGFTGFRSPSTFGSNQILTLPTLSVPSAGSLYACCNIAPTAKLYSINY